MPRAGDPYDGPFHEGERAIQERMGVRDRIEPWARQAIRSFLPEQHRAFYAALPFVVVAARDANGRPWATVLSGPVGFVTTPHDRSLSIAARPVPGDALAHAFVPGADLGLLGIEFSSRRRNRVNGRVSEQLAGAVRVAVDQTFGNCPQHIHQREWSWTRDNDARAARPVASLSPELIAWIERTDTFFVASGHRGDGAHARYGMDASHRGGSPGFVTVHDAVTLSWPELPGNNHFNTLGNLVVDSRVGVSFVDFEHGHLLQITGTASIDWAAGSHAATPGARATVTVAIESIVKVAGALAIRWRSPRTGMRPLRIVRKIPESADVTSFVLESPDGDPLPDFEPGQHLPVEVRVGRDEQPFGRTYSLSAIPNGRTYRISVKREPTGHVSRYLHDRAAPGDPLGVYPPAGDFVLDGAVHRPVALVSAGVGITPLVAMASALAARRPPPPIYFVHGARDRDHHAFAEEVRALARCHPHVDLHVAYSRPAPGDVRGRDYHHRGRVDHRLLAALLPVHEADFYLCGPPAFMAQVRGGLLDLGVSEGCIRTESFTG